MGQEEGDLPLRCQQSSEERWAGFPALAGILGMLPHFSEPFLSSPTPPCFLPSFSQHLPNPGRGNMPCECPEQERNLAW